MANHFDSYCLVVSFQTFDNDEDYDVINILHKVLVL